MLEVSRREGLEDPSLVPVVLLLWLAGLLVVLRSTEWRGDAKDCDLRSDLLTLLNVAPEPYKTVTP